MIGAISAGGAAFVLLSVADELALRGLRRARTAVFGLSCLAMIGGLAWATASGPRLELPVALRVAGGMVVAVSAGLAGLSLFSEVSTHRVSRRLVTTGTYALCRHPGVLWLALFLVSLAAATASRVLVIAAPIWITLDVIHVLAQEKRYLVPVFGQQYVLYRSQVPCLIPSIRSIRRALGANTAMEVSNGRERGERDGASPGGQEG